MDDLNSEVISEHRAECDLVRIVVPDQPAEKTVSSEESWEGRGQGVRDSDEGFDMKHAARKNKEKKKEGRRNASHDVSLSLREVWMG